MPKIDSLLDDPSSAFWSPSGGFHLVAGGHLLTFLASVGFSGEPEVCIAIYKRERIRKGFHVPSLKSHGKRTAIGSYNSSGDCGRSSYSRYMSVVVLARIEEAGLPGPLCFLAAACSDGSVRLFLLLESAKKLCLIAESFHHQHCVLKVEAFAYKMASGRRRHFMGSAATDGSIAFWDVTAALSHIAAIVKTGDIQMKPLALESPVLAIQAHSCGVNSLHIQKTAERRFVVISGSDDGSISVHVIDAKAESAVGQETAARAGIQVVRKVSRLCAHAAHVTGVRLLHLNFLLSVSADQRLTLWSLCKDSLSFVGSKFCHVADVAALACWETEGHSYRSVICGQGLEVLSWGLDVQGREITGGI